MDEALRSIRIDHAQRINRFTLKHNRIRDPLFAAEPQVNERGRINAANAIKTPKLSSRALFEGMQ